MSSTALVLHRGAREVSREELAKVPVPESTETWFPVSHLHVVDRVQEALGQAGFSLAKEKLSLSRGNARLFGVMDLQSEIAAGINLAVGIRNSFDKSFPIGFAAGSRVFCCDNLAFRSEIVVARKHTRFGDERFIEALSVAVQSLVQFQDAEGERIKRLQHTEVNQVTAESLILRAYCRDIISHRLLPRVIAEWEKPSFQEFGARTLWSLFNAHTTALSDRQKSNPQRFAHETIRLSDLFTEAAEG